MNSSTEAVAPPACETEPLEHKGTRRATLEWARQWHEGDAQCPRCGSTEFEIVDIRTDGQMRYETFRCASARCSACWQVEFREAALVVLENDSASQDDWIELLDEPRAMALTVREAATIIAALRHWRRKPPSTDGPQRDVTIDHNEVLTPEEIDALCWRIAAHSGNDCRVGSAVGGSSKRW